jgi:hypothetical protein
MQPGENDGSDCRTIEVANNVPASKPQTRSGRHLKQKKKIFESSLLKIGVLPAIKTAIFEDYSLRVIFFGRCVAVVNHLEMRLFPRLRYVRCVGRYLFAVVLLLLLDLLVVRNIAWVGHMNPLWRL